MPSAKRTADDDAFAKALGKALRMVRKQGEIKATHLAEQIGVMQQSVSAWEAGQHIPSLVVLLRVSQATQIPLWKITRAAEQLHRVAQAREAEKGECDDPDAHPG